MTGQAAILTRSPPESMGGRARQAAEPSGQLFLADAGDGGQHRGQALHFGHGGVHDAFAGVVGEDDQVGLGGALAAHFVGLTLQHRVDADARRGQDAGHTGQHASLVGHAQAQVVAGDDVAHGVGLEGQVRHALGGIGRVQAGDVDQIGNHGAGGGLGAGALAVVQRGAHGIALHHHGVHGAFDVGDQALGRHQAGVHAQLDAVGSTLGDAQQLDAVAELLGVADVGRREAGDAFDIGLVELHRDAESDGAHQGGLVGRIHAFDVEGGVGLGVAQALGLFEHHFKVQALVTHFGQDEVGGAVDDAGDPLDGVGGQAFAQRLDDGDAPRHGGLEGHHHALGRSGREDLGAMHGQQGLVGGDDVLAGGNGFEHQGLGDAVAPDQFDHDVDLGVGNHGAGVVDDLHLIAHHSAGTLDVQVGHHGDLDATARAAADFFLVALQHVEGATANGANAQQANFDRVHSETV